MSSPIGSLHRNRGWYLIAIIAVVAAGLASRKFPGLLPVVFGKYPGDGLWALMVYLGWGLLMPRGSIAKVAAATAMTCVGIETLKLYQAPWMVSLRQSTIGHLIFGHVFSWQNLIAYSVGIAIGTALETVFIAHKTSTVKSSP